MRKIRTFIRRAGRVSGAILAILALYFGWTLYNDSSRLPWTYVRTRELSKTAPTFTQIRKITISKASSKQYRIHLEMAGPIKLNYRDRLGIRLNFGSPMFPLRNKPKDITLFFPVGYSYASKPPLPSGYVGFIEDNTVPENLLSRFACTYEGSTISALVDRKFFGADSRPWIRRFTLWQVYYTHGKDISKWKFENANDSFDSPAMAFSRYDEELNWKLGEGYASFQFFPPHHPKSTYEAEQPTTLPISVRESPARKL